MRADQVEQDGPAESRQLRRLADAGAELAEVGPERFDSICVDLAIAGAPGRAAAHVEQLWGALDMAIHNTGLMLHHDGRLMALPQSILERSLDITSLRHFA